MKRTILMIALGINTIIGISTYAFKDLNFWIVMAAPVTIAILAIFYNLGVFEKRKGLDYQEKKTFYTDIITKP